MEFKLTIPFNTKLQRIVEPMVLGVTANIVVNFIMNHGAGKLPVEEFIAAIVLSFPITELNRHIDKRLENKISWTRFPMQRSATHFGLILICLVVLLNGPGIAYMWIAQKGFFSFNDTIVINLVTLGVAVILTFIQWTVYFYRRWLQAENRVISSNRVIEELKHQLIQPARPIELQKGNSKTFIEAHHIRVAKLVFGTVRIYSDSGLCGTFPGSLTQLVAMLPGHLFFQVSRDGILHKQVIGGIASSAFGKIVVSLHEDYNVHENFTVSRPKAAAFRKWYNSNTA